MPVTTAAGIGMTLIAGEHFFSTFLSSPATTQKFLSEDPEDRKRVRKYYMMACAASLVTAFVMASILDQKWPIITAILLCIMYVAVYEAAMRGKI